MNLLNSILTPCFDWLLAPFVDWPLTGLLFWSVVSGILMTFVFGKTSNQRGVKRSADRTRAQLLAIKLFKDDLSVLFACQVELIKATGRRLLYSLPPMIVLMVPFVFVLSQLGLRYEYQALPRDKTTVVALELSESAWAKHQDVILEVSEGVVVETGPLPDDVESSLYWRLRPVQAGTATLSWHIGSEVVEKHLTVAGSMNQIGRVSPRRPGSGLFDRLLYPGEWGFSADAPVQSISVQQRRRSTPVFGIDLPWWVTFFVVSMLAAFAVRRVLGVEF